MGLGLITKVNIKYSNTPPQVGAYRLYVPSLLQMNSIPEPLSDLIKISAN